MSLGDSLNREIRRLARKEITPVEKELRAALRKLRTEVVQLKQQLRMLSKPRKGLKSSSAAPAEESGVRRRFSPKRLAQLRAKKDLTLAEMAKLAEVSVPTLLAWLNGKTRPSPVRLNRIAWIRGQSKAQLRSVLAE